MAELRYFNERGRIKWGEWLSDLQRTPTLPFPDGLLTNPDLTAGAPGGADVSCVVFESKLEMAQVIAPAIARVRLARFPSHRWPGLWDWLAAFHFDSICPRDNNGTRKVKAFPLYKLEEDWRRKYRHRIFGPVGLFERLGLASRILIHGPPASLTDWEEQAASRYPISSNAGIAQALYQLYWDGIRNAPKRGAAPNEKKPGTLRRFSDLVLQLDRTYDLLSIGSDGIIPLLPGEFDRFRRTS
jgi:hypothetical protein